MKNIITGCLFLCVLFSCKKDVAELPPATETGANTFGAKVNGELWVPQGFGSIPANNILESKLVSQRRFENKGTETLLPHLMKQSLICWLQE